MKYPESLQKLMKEVDDKGEGFVRHHHALVPSEVLELVHQYMEWRDKEGTLSDLEYNIKAQRGLIYPTHKSPGEA